MTERQLCKRCGEPILSSNESGYCRRTRDCDRARQLAWRLSRGQANAAAPLTGKCLNCGSRIRSDNLFGYCGRSLECKRLHQQERLRQQPLRNTWVGAIQRCYNPNNPKYPRYGGRGIRVYELWRNDYPAFSTWILENLGPRPEGRTQGDMPLFSLDRIDNNRDYEPGNLKWSDAKEQVFNRGAQGRSIAIIDALREQVRSLGGVPCA